MSKSLYQFEKKLILPPADQRDEAWRKLFVDNYWMNLGDTSQIHTVNPFSKQTTYDLDNPHVFLLDLMRQPKYFAFTAKHIFGKTLPPFQLAILTEMWIRPFLMLIGSRGMGKSWILAFYIMLKCLFVPGTKVVICGAAFRQAKVVFDYCADIWEKSPILRDIVGPGKHNGPRRDVDRCSLRMGDSIIIALPIGDGTKIRGQRASIVCADEFASVPVEIFETVIRGFGAVSKDPVLKLQQEARIEALKAIGAWSDELEQEEATALMGNQTIISGTAYYAFNHFYTYWKRYKAIVESQGDVHKLEEIFSGKIPEKFNWKDYSVIRIPASKLPPGFMDQRQIAQAKATVHIGTYQMEYEAIFATDSNGFYKRSLIESCVVGKPTNPIYWADGEVRFHCVTKGRIGCQYVMAVDPASENDNLSITILELWPDHRRIVYQWTTTRAKYKARLKKGVAEETDYYGYACRKIRDLMHIFDIERIAVDSQGGGVAIIECLQDKDKLREGERPIYPVIVEGEERDTDHMAGDHILEIINFADATWVRGANHGMRKDFEDKALLFPEFDSALLGLAIEDDKMSGRVTVDNDERVQSRYREDGCGMYDTLEDAIMEIEELKDELATIVHTQTGTSLRDRWDTPETKIAGGKKGRLRKDRYSSLLMANMVARVMQRTPKKELFTGMGGFANQISSGKASGSLYSGPQWWNMDANDYVAVARRR